MVIRYCRIAGLGLDEIVEVVSDRTPSRRRTKQIARDRIVEIDRQLTQLRLARDMMAAAEACRCASVERCDCGAMGPVIDRLRAELGALAAPPDDVG